MHGVAPILLMPSRTINCSRGVRQSGKVYFLRTTHIIIVSVVLTIANNNLQIQRRKKITNLFFFFLKTGSHNTLFFPRDQNSPGCPNPMDRSNSSFVILIQCKNKRRQVTCKVYQRIYPFIPVFKRVNTGMKILKDDYSADDDCPVAVLVMGLQKSRFDEVLKSRISFFISSIHMYTSASAKEAVPPQLVKRTVFLRGLDMKMKFAADQILYC